MRKGTRKGIGQVEREGSYIPYTSRAQQKLFHAKEARGEISPSTVHHWDEATKAAPGGFKALPEKKGKGGSAGALSRLAAKR